VGKLPFLTTAEIVAKQFHFTVTVGEVDQALRIGCPGNTPLAGWRVGNAKSRPLPQIAIRLLIGKIGKNITTGDKGQLLTIRAEMNLAEATRPAFDPHRSTFAIDPYPDRNRRCFTAQRINTPQLPVTSFADNGTVPAGDCWKKQSAITKAGNLTWLTFAKWKIPEILVPVIIADNIQSLSIRCPQWPPQFAGIAKPLTVRTRILTERSIVGIGWA
jgi:hypothetical protein